MLIEGDRGKGGSNTDPAFQGEESSFVFSKLERRKSHGSRRRVAMDSGGALARFFDRGRPLIAAWDECAGVLHELVAMPNSELVGLKDGVVVERVESTLKTTQMLVESDPQSVLDCRLTSVYMLEPAEVSPTLLGALEAGKTFTFPFNYRPLSCRDRLPCLQQGGYLSLLDMTRRHNG